MDTLEDDEWSEFYRVRMAEIPVGLATRAIVNLGGESVFWVDGFRGYATGFTFVTWYRFDEDVLPKSDPDLWPDLTATTPTGTFATIEVIVDGEQRSNLLHEIGRLHLVGANGVPGIAMAEWWVPRLPLRSLAISFRYEPFSDAGHTEVSISEWPTLIAGGIIAL